MKRKKGFGFLFKQIHLAFEMQRTQNMKSMGLTPAQMDILLFLSMRQREEITQKDIETALRLSNPTVTGILNRMEEKDMIRRVRKEEDKRCRLVQMTDKSRICMESLRQDMEQEEERLTKGMTSQQTEEFRNMLKMVLTNITGQEEPEIFFDWEKAGPE